MSHVEIAIVAYVLASCTYTVVDILRRREFLVGRMRDELAVVGEEVTPAFFWSAAFMAVVFSPVILPFEFFAPHVLDDDGGGR